MSDFFSQLLVKCNRTTVIEEICECFSDDRCLPFFLFYLPDLLVRVDIYDNPLFDVFTENW
jgi:hypothetical protein